MEGRTLRRYERLLVLILWAAPIVTALGLVALNLPRPGLQQVAIIAATLGLLLAFAAGALSLPIRILRTVGRADTGGATYDQLRHWGRLKISAVLLNLLLLLATIIIVAGLLVRLGHLDAAFGTSLVFRGASLLVLAIVVNATHAHYLSLRIPIERKDDRGPVIVFVYILGALVLLLGALAVLVADRSLVIGPMLFSSQDAPVILLAAFGFTTMGLILTRGLPTIFFLFAEEKNFYAGRSYFSRAKSVLLPVSIAFALLLVIVVALFFIGVGAEGLESPVQSAVIGFIVLAMLASIVVSVRLARSEDRLALYRLRRSREARRSLLVLWISWGLFLTFGLVAAALLRGYGILGLPTHLWVDFLSLGLLGGLGPYGFYVAQRLRRIRLIEERFPDFLRDVAASHKGGLTLTASVAVAARGEYGQLTPEIRKMADQLSWHIPFIDALEQLAARVKTPLVQRTVTLISEASRSGGNTADVLIAAARDAREIKNLENERRTTMSLYGIIIYITFFVFLSVAAILYGSFVPEIVKAADAARALGGAGGITFDAPTITQYRSFFFMAALVQAVGNGLVAGMMQSGRPSVGLRHAFLMVLITYVTFALVLR